MFVRRRIGAAAIVFALFVLLVSLFRGSPEPPAGPSVQVLHAVPGGSIGSRDWRGMPTAAAQAAAVRHYLRLGRPIYCAAGRLPYAALTFDDGPGAFSDQVLRQLEKGGAQATFFLIGRQVAGNEELVRRHARIGALGDHTWNHSDLTKLSGSGIRQEVSDTRHVLETANRGERITLFRPPYAARDSRTDAAIGTLRLLQVLWNVDTQDSAGAGPDTIVTQVDAGLRPGSIVLMHETYDRSVAALPRVLAIAHRRGLRLVTVPELLALDPPSDSMVREVGGGCRRG